jgi:hypothetical protein
MIQIKDAKGKDGPIDRERTAVDEGKCTGYRLRRTKGRGHPSAAPIETSVSLPSNTSERAISGAINRTKAVPLIATR